jgi:cytochrome P450
VSRSTVGEIYFDSYDVDLVRDPYPMYKRMRDEMPLYYNEQYDFFAVTRYAEVEKSIIDHRTFSSARGNILEFIKAGLDVPKGLIVMEDPPLQTIHRKVLSRMFTPRKLQVLEDRIRAFCVNALDPIVGTGRFNFVEDLGAQMPMRVIGMLLGFPDEKAMEARDFIDSVLTTEPGQPMQAHWRATSTKDRCMPTTSNGARTTPQTTLSPNCSTWNSRTIRGSLGDSNGENCCRS